MMVCLFFCFIFVKMREKEKNAQYDHSDEWTQIGVSWQA
jgi:hypothetical protein